MTFRVETEFEIIASTTAGILRWIDNHPAIAVSSEDAQIEIGKRVKSAMERAVKLHMERGKAA